MALQICTTMKHFTCIFYSKLECKMQQPHKHNVGRRTSLTSLALATAFTLNEATSGSNIASSFELSITVPDQTPEEANAVVKQHARDLVKLKTYIDSQSWREVQIALRESSAYLKQDIYTIIQSKPGGERPYLRKLYSDLFNNVSMLDYAARDKDKNRVDECYDNIIADLNDFFSRI